MAVSKLKKFVNDHLFGIVVSALASLATVVGGYLLVAIKIDLDQLQCRISQFGAKNEYKAVQLKLIVTPLDDVNRMSEPYKELVNIISSYRTSLQKCEDGRDDLAQIVNYRLGLESFIDRDWDKAIGFFGSISDRTALTEKSMANALLHKYFALKAANDLRAADVYRQWLVRITAAHNLATRESDNSVKERAVAYLRCSVLLVGAPTDEAIDCLKKLVDGGQANYGVYYNLAALHARKGSFEIALAHMEQCIKMPGGFNQRRADVEADIDFKLMLADVVFGPRLKKVLLQLPL